MPLNAKVVEIEPTGDVWDYEGTWEHDLCDCCSDCKKCCCAIFCFPCFGCSTIKRAGDNCCIALIPFGCMAFRTKIRTAFRIKGSMCNDCCVSCFCCCCAMLQIAHELDKLEDNDDKPKKNTKKNERKNKTQF